LHYEEELERMRLEEEEAFRRKQDAWQDYMIAKEAANVAYETVQLRLEDRRTAKEDLDREYEVLQKAYEQNRGVWDSFRQSRDYYVSRIESLRKEASAEHQAMCECFEQANSAYGCGDKAMAPKYSAEGHEHRMKRDKLNIEISLLCRKIKEARQDAERCAPRPDRQAFDAAKAIFDEAKAMHQEAHACFRLLESKNRQAKEKFYEANAEHTQARAALRSKLSEVKADNNN